MENSYRVLNELNSEDMPLDQTLPNSKRKYIMWETRVRYPELDMLYFKKVKVFGFRFHQPAKPFGHPKFSSTTNHESGLKGVATLVSTRWGTHFINHICDTTCKALWMVFNINNHSFGGY